MEYITLNITLPIPCEAKVSINEDVRVNILSPYYDQIIKSLELSKETIYLLQVIDKGGLG